MEGALFRLAALVTLGIALILTWRRIDYELRSRWIPLGLALPWLGGWIVLSSVETAISIAGATTGGPSLGNIHWCLHQGAGLLLIGAIWQVFRCLRKGQYLGETATQGGKRG